MNEPTQEPTPSPTLGDQLPALMALVAMAETHPTLPEIRVAVTRDEIALSLHNAPVEAWEIWRSTLGLDPAGAELGAEGEIRWIEVSGRWAGVRVNLAGFAVPDPADVVRAAEQAHQVDPHDAQFGALASGTAGGAGAHPELFEDEEDEAVGSDG